MSQTFTILALLAFAGIGAWVVVKHGKQALTREKRFVAVGLGTLAALFVVNSMVIAPQLAEGVGALEAAEADLRRAYGEAKPTFEAITRRATEQGDGDGTPIDPRAAVGEHTRRFQAETANLDAEREFLQQHAAFEIAPPFVVPEPAALFERLGIERREEVRVEDYGALVEDVFLRFFARRYGSSPEYTFLPRELTRQSVAQFEDALNVGAYASADASGLAAARVAAAERLACHNLVVAVTECARAARVRQLVGLQFESPGAAMKERCRLDEPQDGRTFFDPIVLSFTARLDELSLFRLLGLLVRATKPGLGDARQPLAIESMVIDSPLAMAEDGGQHLLDVAISVVAYRINPDVPFVDSQAADDADADPAQPGGRGGASRRPRYW